MIDLAAGHVRRLPRVLLDGPAWVVASYVRIGGRMYALEGRGRTREEARAELARLEAAVAMLRPVDLSGGPPR